MSRKMLDRADILERIEELLVRRCFDDGSNRQLVTLKVAREGEAALNSKERRIWNRVIVPRLKLLAFEDEETQQAFDDEDRSSYELQD